MELSPEALAVIGKVQKLLALANGNMNEHEAASASQKALDLLAAYNLDMTTVEKNTGNVGKRSDTRLGGGLYQWQRTLWHSVSELHFCMYWYIKGTRKGQKYEHRILGRQENVLGCKLMAEYLQQAIERLARERVGNDGSQFFTKASISFREGCAARITARLRDLREQRLAEDRRRKSEEAARAKHPGSAPGTALVLQDTIDAERDANMDFLNGEGWSARQRASRAEAEAAYEKEMAKRRQWEIDHPEEHARNEEARRKEYERAQKEEARKASRRKGVTTHRTRAYKGDADAYWEGYAKGKDVGLDQQVDHNPPRDLE